MISNGVFKMINTGTSWQHFKNANYDPVNLYAATKHAFEAVLKYYIETTALNVITLKLFDTYGPDDRRPKLFNLLKQTEYRNIPLPMSQGEQLIDAVYIDDVIEAFLMAGKRLLDREHARYEEYAVSSGDPVSLRDLVRLYEKLAGKQLLINWGERPYRDREVMVPWNRGKLLPGWSPQYSLQEGLKNLRGEVHDGN
jgi:nucleoside-diphosphate-sugar epimerase